MKISILNPKAIPCSSGDGQSVLKTGDLCFGSEFAKPGARSTVVQCSRVRLARNHKFCPKRNGSRGPAPDCRSPMVLALDRCTGSSSHEMHDQRNHCHDQQNVQKPPGDVEDRPTENPRQQQHHEQDEENHLATSALVIRDRLTAWRPRPRPQVAPVKPSPATRN